MDQLDISELEDRRAYRVHARNFDRAVWSDDKMGFIGIRLKFDFTFLDIEYHGGPGTGPMGTAMAIEALDAVVPEDIELVTGYFTELGFQQNAKLFEFLKQTETRPIL